MKVYGPYTRKDKRQHVLFKDSKGKLITQSYPRYLMEIQLGRKLTNKEEVDHVNNNPADNRIENLQILSKEANLDKSKKTRKLYKFVCPSCKIETIKFLNYVVGNKKKGRRGPYCSRQCAGKATYVNPWRHTVSESPTLT